MLDLIQHLFERDVMTEPVSRALAANRRSLMIAMNETERRLEGKPTLGQRTGAFGGTRGN